MNNIIEFRRSRSCRNYSLGKELSKSFFCKFQSIWLSSEKCSENRVLKEVKIS